MTPFKRTKQPRRRFPLHDTAVVARETKRPEEFKTAIPLGTDESAAATTARDLDEIPLHSTTRASATTQQLPLDDAAKVRAWAQRVRFTCVQWVQQHQRLLARQYEQLHYEQAQWQQYRAKQEWERRKDIRSASPSGANDLVETLEDKEANPGGMESSASDNGAAIHSLEDHGPAVALHQTSETLESVDENCKLAAASCSAVSTTRKRRSSKKVQSDGTVIKTYTNGAVKTTYPVAHHDKQPETKIEYPNGDILRHFNSQIQNVNDCGSQPVVMNAMTLIQEYFFAATNVRRRIVPDCPYVIWYFPLNEARGGNHKHAVGASDGVTQMEYHYHDGRKLVHFPNGTTKWILNGKGEEPGRHRGGDALASCNDDSYDAPCTDRYESVVATVTADEEE
jgi:hypothetical protein